MSLNFDATGELLEAYETIQSTPLNPSRLYQPLFFSTGVPVHQPGKTHEASMYSMTNWVNKKFKI